MTSICCCPWFQVLDGLQYLHHRGVVHLNVQPDNVVMVSRRRLDIKLIDFGRARKITSTEGVFVEREGTAEFMGKYKYKSIATEQSTINFSSLHD